MTFSWNQDKNVVALEAGDILAVLAHPSPARHPGQRVYVVEIDGYAWAVPYRDERGRRVLITAYPSRRLTRDYLRGVEPDEGQS